MNLPHVLLLVLGLYFTASILFGIFYEKHLETWDRLIVAIFSLFKLALSVSFVSTYFLGLEYEDAYVWSANALFLENYVGFGQENFVTSSCLFGSVDHCIYTGSFSSHLILFPTILWGISKVAGFTPYLVSWVNCFFSLLIVGRLYKVALLLLQNRVCACFSVLILTTAPIISVFHTTGFVETFSSYVLLSCLYYYLAYDQVDSMRWPSFALFILSFLIAALAKRENLLLAIIPCVGLLIRLIQRRPLKAGSVLAETVALTVIGVIYLATTGILQTEIGEAADIGGHTFSLSYLLQLVPPLTEALWNFKWFSLCSGLIFVGFLLSFFCRPRVPMLLYPGLLSLSYLTLYLIHYRSYYFVVFGDATSAEWLRYLTNIYPLLSLMGGYTLYFLSQIRRTRTWLIPSAVLALVAVQVLQVPELQRQLYREEYEIRISPVTATLEYIRQTRALIVTDKPLLFQSFGGPHLEVLDVYSASPAISSDAMKEYLMKYDKIYFVRPTDFDSAAGRKRFPGHRSLLEDFEPRKIKELGRGYDLYELKIKDSLKSLS